MQIVDNKGRVWKYNPDLDSMLERDGVEVKGSFSGRKGEVPYRRVSFNNKNIPISRLIWSMFNGEIPEGYVVDHINRIRSDDRIENLRCIPKHENMYNKSRYKKTGSKGQTGTVGVILQNTKTGFKYRAMWWDAKRKLRSKNFSVKKYGDELAYFLACESRHLALLELKHIHGIEYSESHY